MASTALIGCQSKAFAPEDAPIDTVSIKFVQPLVASAKTPIETARSLKSPLLDKTYQYCDKSKYASIIMDAVTGEILYGRNENAARHPASMTKLMTLFLTFEEVARGRLQPNDLLRIDKNYTRNGLSMLCVNTQDQLTVQQAEDAIIARSAGDVTDVLAINITGNVKDFVKKMNLRARSLGMSDTHFTNTSGAHDPKQVSTARDMAVLMRALQQYFPDQCAVFDIDGLTYHDLYIPNKIKKIPGVDMGKTGQTDQSGLNLAASFPDKNGRAIIVLFGAKNTLSRKMHMLDLHEESKSLLEKNATTDKLVHTNNTALFTHLPIKMAINQLEDLGTPVPAKYDLQWAFTFGAPAEKTILAVVEDPPLAPPQKFMP